MKMKLEAQHDVACFANKPLVKMNEKKCRIHFSLAFVIQFAHKYPKDCIFKVLQTLTRLARQDNTTQELSKLSHVVPIAS